MPAQESRCLQDIDDRRYLIDLVLGMHIGQHRHADLSLHLGQNRQPLVNAEAAERLARTTIRLVVGGLEDVRNAKFGANLLHLPGNIQTQLPGFRHTRASDQKQRLIETNRKAAQVHADALCASAASTKDMNSGWPVRGLLVNSG